MRRFFKKYASIIYIFLSGVLVLVLIARSPELSHTLKAFRQIQIGWLHGCVGLIIAYLLLRVLTLTYYLRREGFQLSWLDAICVTGVGQFYSAITPSASGGQPMQALTMHRMGIPVSTATATVSVKFIGFQIANLLTGAVLWALNARIVKEQLEGMRWLVTVGFAINAALLFCVVLAILNERLINRAVNWAIHTGARLRLIHNEPLMLNKTQTMLAEYRAALKRLMERPGDALVILGLSCLQVLCLMSVTALLYPAFGLQGHGWSEMTALQTLLFITASFVPLPGAAGAQEGGFYLFFRGIFPESNILAVMLCWRFLTYYFLMLFGFAAVATDTARRWIMRRRKKHE